MREFVRLKLKQLLEADEEKPKKAPDREEVWARYLAGESTAEIAYKLNISPKFVEATILKLRKAKSIGAPTKKPIKKSKPEPPLGSKGTGFEAHKNTALMIKALMRGMHPSDVAHVYGVDFAMVKNIHKRLATVVLHDDREKWIAMLDRIAASQDPNIRWDKFTSLLAALDSDEPPKQLPIEENQVTPPGNVTTEEDSLIAKLDHLCLVLGPTMTFPDFMEELEDILKHHKFKKEVGMHPSVVVVDNVFFERLTLTDDITVFLALARSQTSQANVAHRQTLDVVSCIATAGRNSSGIGPSHWTRLFTMYTRTPSP